MELYTQTAFELSKHLTLRYSTSFGISSRLFQADIQPAIYAIYGLVRIADEIVDTYQQSDSAQRLDALEQETYRAIATCYSPNPIVHAFAMTCTEYQIEHELIEAFFTSMRMDLTPRDYTEADYATYIYGSAEVIGLMCLTIFTKGDIAQYQTLAPGARALGAAYQKVNFLRDMASDHQERGRLYFPGVTFESFTEADKQAIIADIDADFATALPYLKQLPRSSKKATVLSYRYYSLLLKTLKNTPAATIQTRRVRVPAWRKLSLLAAVSLGLGVAS